jgi:hypothetical protein
MHIVGADHVGDGHAVFADVDWGEPAHHRVRIRDCRGGRGGATVLFSGAQGYTARGNGGCGLSASTAALRYFALNGTDHRDHVEQRRSDRRVYALAQRTRRTQARLRPRLSNPDLNVA